MTTAAQEQTPLNTCQQTFNDLQNSYRAEPVMSYDDRRKHLLAMKQLLIDNRSDIQTAISQDYGSRARQETDLVEIHSIVDGINYILKHLKKWMKPQKRHVSIMFFGGKNTVIPQPKGVIGVVTPWNYPIFLSFGPVSYSLAAGNRTMIKMAANSQNLCRLLAKLCPKYMPADVVTFLPAVSAREFTAIPYNHLVFTGSESVGKTVMATAAQYLTPVTLELGGKSPVIIADDFDIVTAAQRLAYSKTLNSGQTCLAPDYVFVPRGKEAAFIEALGDQCRKMYPNLNSQDYTCVIDQRAYDRLQDTLADAEGKSEKVVNVFQQDANHQARKMPLQVVVNPSDDAIVMQEEIFGPLFPIKSYDTIDECLAFIKDRARPLGLYLFSNNKQIQQHVINNTMSGGVTINDSILHGAQHDMPFGGSGASGMGHYHGKEGFIEFSKMRPVFQQSKRPMTLMMAAPYGKRFERMINFVMR